MRLVLTLCLIAACYSPNTPAGRPCTIEIDNCPSGQVCTNNICLLAGEQPDGPPAPDAGVDAGEDGGIPGAPDVDGDGKPDALDNCPAVANADQADEDGDMIGDACDGCANLADAPLVDGDGDGIGDACDPNQGAMDIRWEFEGFHGTTFPVSWGKSTGWSFGNDAVLATSEGNQDSSDEFLDPKISATGRTLDKFSIAMTFVVDSTQGDDGVHEFGVGFFNASQDRTLYCNLQLQDGNGGGRGVAIDEAAPDGSGQREAETFAWKTGSEYRLTFVRQGRIYTCTLVGPGTEGSRTVMITSNVVPVSEADISVFGATVQLRSVLILGPPP